MKVKYKMGILRSQSALGMVELVCVVIVMVPIALLAINICSISLGGFINDEACREAARAAATQTTSVSGSMAADAAIQSYILNSGAMISTPQINGYVYYMATDNSDPTDPVPITLTSLNLTNLAQAPYVQVNSTLTATTPAPMLIAGNSLANQVTLQNACSFPILSGIDPDPNDMTDSGGDNPPNNSPSPASSTPANHAFGTHDDLHPPAAVSDGYGP